MEQLERIEGLVNLNLLDDLKKTVTVITLDLYQEGFDAKDIAEYLNIVIKGKIVTTIYNIENK